MPFINKTLEFAKGLRSIILPFTYVALQFTLTYYLVMQNVIEMDLVPFYILAVASIAGIVVMSDYHFQPEREVLFLDGIAIPTGWVVTLAVFFIFEPADRIDNAIAGNWVLIALYVTTLVLFFTAIFDSVLIYIFAHRVAIIKRAPKTLSRLAVVTALPISFIVIQALALIYFDKMHGIHTNWYLYSHALVLYFIFLSIYGFAFYSANKRTLILASTAQPLLWGLAVALGCYVKFVEGIDLLSPKELGATLLMLGLIANLSATLFYMHFFYEKKNR
ncbi:hypothetical protein H9T43_002397 [Salmonella enterica]|nr:hypothetical protein [Salmonella enterica]